MTGFIPDIMRVLRRYNTLHYVEDYYDEEVFPSKSRWKSIAKLAIKEVHENELREKVMSNLQLKIYVMVHDKLETIFWWHLAREYPDYLGEITDLLRILCGSYTPRGKRMEDFENSSAEYEKCHMSCRKSLKHVLVYGRESEVERNILWHQVMNTLPLNISVELHLLEDDEFIAAIFGHLRGLSNLCDDDKDKVFLRTAKYISYIRVHFFN